MELRHLRYFVAVADELHFGRAAARIHTSQPSLSQQIRNLEKELGVPLLKRSRHRVELTAAGRRFLDEARQILASAEYAARVARLAASEEALTMTLGISPETNWGFLRKVLRHFSRRRPRSEIAFRSLTSGTQVDALRSKEIDLGFVSLPLDDRRMTTEVVERVRLVVALPEKHPQARQPTVALPELSEERYALWPRHFAPGLFDQLERSFRAAGFGPPVMLEGGLPTARTMVGMVSAGLTIALLQPTARHVARAGVVFRKTREPVFVSLGVIYRPEKPSEILGEFLGSVRAIAARSKTTALDGDVEPDTHSQEGA